ncbi:valacyclovir hydrolase isoform X3 [Marmota marmota marmota]|uniref:valacyclovir hydrolase isoform X3 n=1 Tax=Marmota marmota marmota TaxID=9994 RepID=UPI0020934A85|nr:valacyclovir hydrolase isoform X3 [Marmota marmota marmota]
MVVRLCSRGGLLPRLLFSPQKPKIYVPTAGRKAAYGTVTSAKVSVNGVHLHYQQTGEGEHAVLLLPGMLGSGETDFAPQLKSLNKNLFTVVAWDPRGYGHSRPPDRDFPVDFFERDAKDAVDLMKTLKFKKISLLGWSDGGITALFAAAKYPSYINKMVIWGANAYVTEEDERIYQGIRDVSKWSEKARKPLEALYGYDYLAKTCEKWVDGIGQFKHLPDGNICRHLLPLVQCPTLIVHGEKDPLVPRFHADFIHEQVKGSRFRRIHHLCLYVVLRIKPGPHACQVTSYARRQTQPAFTFC